MNYSYDEALQDVEKILKANLNTCIAEINAKKSDLVLDTVDANNYFYNLSETVNQKIFVYLEIERTENRSAGNRSADVVFVNVFLAFSGKGRSPKDNTFMTYRYESAIRDSFTKQWNSLYRYEGGRAGSVTINNQAIFAAMCTYSIALN